MQRLKSSLRKMKFMKKSGFSLVEVMLALSIGSVVTVVVLNTFLWCGKQAVICTKSGWSQREAMITA